MIKLTFKDKDKGILQLILIIKDELYRLLFPTDERQKEILSVLVSVEINIEHRTNRIGHVIRKNRYNTQKSLSLIIYKE